MEANTSKQIAARNNVIDLIVDNIKKNTYNKTNLHSNQTKFEEKKINDININPISNNKKKSSIKIDNQILLKYKNKPKYKNIKNINKIKKNKILNNYNKKEEETGKENNSKQDENSNSQTRRIIYIIVTILFIAFILYIIFAKYLCVGFIKVYDSQIVEFSQPNKIEII